MVFLQVFRKKWQNQKSTKNVFIRWFQKCFFGKKKTLKNFITNYLIFWIWSFIKITWFAFAINIRDHSCSAKSVFVPYLEYRVNFQTLKNAVIDINLMNVNCLVMQLDILNFWMNILLLIRSHRFETVVS